FTMSAGAVTLYARWSANSYPVAYDGNGFDGGSVPASASHATDSTVTVLGNTGSLVKTGYTFAGWNTQAGGGGTGYAPGATFTMPADAVTLYAQWEALPMRTVTFNANDGAGSMSQQTKNVPTALTANTFIRTGYSFTGWNTAANGSGTAYANQAVYPFTADATLYAQWSALPMRTVTFNANDGAGSMSSQTKNVPTALTANTFTRAGYSFTGWNTAANGSGTAYANQAVYPFTADATLHAQWLALPCSSYSVGDIGPGGGRIVYKDTSRPSGSQCFEAAPFQWQGGPANDPSLKWGISTCANKSISTGTAIGTGAGNTNAITSACSTANAPAAWAAKNYAGGGLTDWFLPSKDELNKVYLQSSPLGASGNYWSSSQATATNKAWMLNFYSFVWLDVSKYETSYRVRPVRAF
ncbi:MAG: InlB B-repeat-containing protein, partial [Candidatus Nanopelagicales bacterium]|nr:InlB B-repeat-containing protein [Candidatus Nanopelagicales bacterium]